MFRQPTVLIWYFEYQEIRERKEPLSVDTLSSRSQTENELRVNQK